MQPYSPADSGDNPHPMPSSLDAIDSAEPADKQQPRNIAAPLRVPHKAFRSADTEIVSAPSHPSKRDDRPFKSPNQKNYIKLNPKLYLYKLHPTLHPIF